MPGPLNPYTGAQASQSQPVLWWVLINQAEWLTKQSRWGLAHTWGLIHAEDYPSARESLNSSLAEWRRSSGQHFDTPATNSTLGGLLERMEK